MFKSDKVVGMFYPEAVKWLDRCDLWEEVVSIVTDEHGTVTKIIH